MPESDSSLRISINTERKGGPYGGANAFTNNLQAYLESQGHEVFRSLVPKIDLILIVSSRKNEIYQGNNAYDYLDVRDYVRLNPETAVVQRVNTCDEQRGERLGNNKGMLKANKLADYTVFVSEFMREHFVPKGMSIDNDWSVIHNGADASVFNPGGRAEWEPGDPIRIVTHHWSSNYLKGFDIYERLDQLLGYEPYSDYFEFTIVGNKPFGLTLENSTIVSPLSGRELAAELKNHHCYVTAARYEAGPNHVAEGLACGLPMLYLDTGALPEYCEPYGVEFDLTNFEEKLEEIREDFETYHDSVLEYDHSAGDVVSAYEEVFRDVVATKRSGDIPSVSPATRLKIRFRRGPYQRAVQFYRLARKAKKHL